MNSRLNYRFVVSALSIGILGWAIPATAAAPGLSIVQKDAKTSLNVCIDNAAQVMRKIKFDDIKVVGEQVYGSFQNYTVAILCYPIKASEGLILQSVIVSGSSGKEAEKLRNALEQELFSLHQHDNEEKPNPGRSSTPESGDINQDALQTNVLEGTNNNGINQSNQSEEIPAENRRFNRGTYSPRSLPGRPTTFPRTP